MVSPSHFCHANVYYRCTVLYSSLGFESVFNMVVLGLLYCLTKRKGCDIRVVYIFFAIID